VTGLNASLPCDVKVTVSWCYVQCSVAESSDKLKLERIPDSELAQIVDGILDDNDGNHDGFIDYPEFLMTQRQQM